MYNKNSVMKHCYEGGEIMANRIEGVHEKLLECAKEEFLVNGFERASIRTIAKNANTSTNSIYVRFADKENLYRCLVEPVIEGFLVLLDSMFSGFSSMSGEKQKENVYTSSDSGFDRIISYIYDNFDLFKILIMSGEVNIYQEFLHRVVDLDVACTTKYLTITNNDAMSCGRLNDNLAHILSVAFYSGFFEIIIHDMPKDESISNIARLRNFYKRGWEDIFNK